MPVELLTTITGDGVKLEGALRMPDAPPHPALDAMVLVHGTGSNFYGSSVLTGLANSLAAEGIAALVVNTRGHDAMCTLSSSTGPQRGGAAYERIDDCRLDLAAWLKTARGRGLLRVGLLGHSLGGLKSLYYAAQAGHEGPACVVAISPPRLEHEALRNGPRGAEFTRAFAEAHALVEAGHGETLLEATFPFPYVVTAAGFIDKYGPSEQYHLLRLVRAVPCRLLAVYGGAEVRMPANVAFYGTPEAVEQACAERAAPGQVAVIAGGDHFYAGTRDALAAIVTRWLRRMASDGSN